MDTSLHSHIVSIHIQERIAFAERERFARQVRRDSKPRRQLAPPPPPDGAHPASQGGRRPGVATRRVARGRRRGSGDRLRVVCG